MNMEQDEPKYVQVLRERYTPADDAEYEEEADFLWMLNAPEQCEVQEEVLGYMEAHPEARLKELVQFFDSLFPDGSRKNIRPQRMKKPGLALYAVNTILKKLMILKNAQCAAG